MDLIYQHANSTIDYSIDMNYISEKRFFQHGIKTMSNRIRRNRNSARNHFTFFTTCLVSVSKATLQK